ncbi:MAG: restriction endonuclease subunit S [Desulfobulbaceae bacterium]|nr:restriction endonuclease subunit S [Desulfobulbaceae bacterium]
MRKIKTVEPITPLFTKEELPTDWDLAPINDICLPVDKVNPKDNPDHEFQYIDISGIDNKILKIIQTKNYLGKDAPSRARQLVQSGDIVFSTVRTYLRNIARVSEKLDGQIASTGFCVLRAVEPELKKYLFYYVQYEKFLNELAKFQRGTSYPAVRGGDVFAQFIPVPPLKQADSIVAEIEKQFSRIDEAVANLKRVKVNLKRYKAAVLKAAVEGKLTEEWRKQHPDVEPASKLIERILTERRPKWEEAELAKMKAKGKTPKDDKWKMRYKDPGAPDIAVLPELPKGWIWVTGEQVCGFITKGTTPAAKKLTTGDGEVQFLKVYNLTFDGSLNHTHKPAFVSRETHEGALARSKVVAGDVLINIVGPPLGQVSVVPLIIPEANINQAIARYRPVAPLGTMYLAYALMAKSVIGWAISRAKTTAGQSNLTLELCRNLPVPLPPLVEQHHIVAEVERRLSLVIEVEAQLESNLKRAERLRQSILNKAFSGQLIN